MMPAPAWSTTAPAALTALVALFRAAPGLSGVAVFDGPVVSERKANEAVCVGFTGQRMNRTGAYPEAPEAGVEHEFQPPELGMTQLDRYTIHNMAAVLNGARDGMPAARARAYDLVTIAAAALAADKTLGGVVKMASVSSASLTQEPSQRGFTATVVFDVAVEAFTGGR
jgi:hypothetical protein